jgi:hypothetical protein
MLEKISKMPDRELWGEVCKIFGIPKELSVVRATITFAVDETVKVELVYHAEIPDNPSELTTKRFELIESDIEYGTDKRRNAVN